MTWLNITSIIFNILSSLAIITAFIVFIANFVTKNKNLKLFNTYLKLIRIAPIISTYGEKILDNYAGYTLNLNNGDKSFNTFNLHRLHVANRRLKRINRSVNSFIEAYKKICPKELLGLNGKTFFMPPFDYMHFSFDTKWGKQELSLKYHLKDINISCPTYLIFRFELDEDVITYYKLTPEQLFYLNESKCIFLPTYRIIDKEDFSKNKTVDFNCMVDNDYYYKFLLFKIKRKYPERSYYINRLPQCTIADEKFMKLNCHYDMPYEPYPNRNETEKKFFKNVIDIFKKMNFIIEDKDTQITNQNS